MTTRTDAITIMKFDAEQVAKADRAVREGRAGIALSSDVLGGRNIVYIVVSAETKISESDLVNVGFESLRDGSTYMFTGGLYRSANAVLDEALDKLRKFARDAEIVRAY